MACLWAFHFAPASAAGGAPVLQAGSDPTAVPFSPCITLHTLHKVYDLMRYKGIAPWWKAACWELTWPVKKLLTNFRRYRRCRRGELHNDFPIQSDVQGGRKLFDDGVQQWQQGASLLVRAT